MASIPEACQYLGIRRSFLYRLMERGELPWAKIGARRVIPWKALRRYAAERLVGVRDENAAKGGGTV
ncbi:MAG: helix-turn-helix domain-containing protein [Firmicutes bacterium]|nr:helix-turn-helix domain-containing protein [Bacillota bacterium]